MKKTAVVTRQDILAALKKMHPDFTMDDVGSVERHVAFSRAFSEGNDPDFVIVASPAGHGCECGSQEVCLSVSLREVKTGVTYPYLVCCGSCFIHSVSSIRQMCQLCRTSLPVKAFVEWSRLLHSCGHGKDFEPSVFTPERYTEIQGMFCLTLGDVQDFDHVFGHLVRE